MLMIYPFPATLAPAELAARVSCPPYDVLSSQQVEQLAADPINFVRVIRPEVDLEPGQSIEQGYLLAKRQLTRQLSEGSLVEVPEPGMYLYRMCHGSQSQTGLVACYDVGQYRDGTIKKHETTRPDKEDDRVRLMLECSSQIEPVFLAIRGNQELRRLIDEDVGATPLFDFVANDGIQHTAWPVSQWHAYQKAMESIPAAYIADGHHRTAAAERVASQRASQNPDHNGDEEYNRVLAVFFPADELTILAYNRIVKSVPSGTVESLMEHISRLGDLSEVDDGTPEAAGEIRFYMQGQWRQLVFAADPSFSDPILGLDVDRLQRLVLGPILGIDDPRTDARIGFVGGRGGVAEMQHAVDAGRAVIAFSLYPTSIESLIDVSDAGKLMPPKSTWFEPKLRSGLFLHGFESYA